MEKEKTILEKITGRDNHKKYYPIVNPILKWVLGIPPKEIDEESVYALAAEIEKELHKEYKVNGWNLYCIECSHDWREIENGEGDFKEFGKQCVKCSGVIWECSCK